MDAKVFMRSSEPAERMMGALAGQSRDYRAVLVWAAARAGRAAPAGRDADAFVACVLARLHRARALYRPGDDPEMFLNSLIELEARLGGRGRKRPSPAAKGAPRVTAPGG